MSPSAKKLVFIALLFCTLFAIGIFYSLYLNPAVGVHHGCGFKPVEQTTQFALVAGLSISIPPGYYFFEPKIKVDSIGGRLEVLTLIRRDNQRGKTEVSVSSETLRDDMTFSRFVSQKTVASTTISNDISVDGKKTNKLVLNQKFAWNTYYVNIDDHTVIQILVSRIPLLFESTSDHSSFDKISDELIKSIKFSNSTTTYQIERPCDLM